MNEPSQGHRIRDRVSFATPKEIVKIPVVIVGGGIAGLSAAWQLERKGFHDFVVLEMEREAGGNSCWGANEISEFPWAAHYIPVPNRSSVVERELFHELGLLNEDESWNDQHLCREPQERLFIGGEWQDGLHPHIGETAKDKEDHVRFYGLIDRMRDSGDFTIAFEHEAKLKELDKITMQQWMQENGLTSPYLFWYVDYACRDDYGSTIDETSAWAGIHYFACREDTEDRVFTWPEGNGWIVKELLRKLASKVAVNQLVYRVSLRGKTVAVYTEQKMYLADNVIFSAPTFLAPYLIEGMRPLSRDIWQYSPWLTANILLEEPPKNGKGEKISWDNVIYNSPALGYIAANHQTGPRQDGKMVWTFYWALADGTPTQNRHRLLTADWNNWKEKILRDLEKAHPDIRTCVSRVDIMRLGHAMVRPVVGAIFHEERRRLANQSGNILFANSDLCGFSIFEEAQHYGVKAANQVLAKVGGKK